VETRCCQLMWLRGGGLGGLPVNGLISFDEGDASGGGHDFVSVLENRWNSFLQAAVPPNLLSFLRGKFQHPSHVPPDLVSIRWQWTL